MFITYLYNYRTVIVWATQKYDFSVMLSNDKILLKFARRVKELRVKRGLTQEDAFNDTGIHFGRIEQGKRDVALTTLVRIADYFKVSVGELVD